MTADFHIWEIITYLLKWGAHVSLNQNIMQGLRMKVMQREIMQRLINRDAAV